ncbi:hypothetical protein TNCV_954111 [Trichonephila clavipes]|nr:hypothetical protein TNCV_954111 [Trichonephila clavipes]
MSLRVCYKAFAHLLIKIISLNFRTLRRVDTLKRGPNEIINLFREISENESEGGDLSWLTLDSDEDISLRESDYEESEESADKIDNNSVNPDICVTKDGTEWIPHNVPVGKSVVLDASDYLSAPRRVIDSPDVVFEGLRVGLFPIKVSDYVRNPVILQKRI